MQGSMRRAGGLALAALWTAAGAQAQDVHKCTINGQVTYQAQSCPSGDVVLPNAPTPSDQERRQAGIDLSRQRIQAGTGRIIRPVVAPPPPPPPSPPRLIMMPATTTTTVIVMPSAGRPTVVVNQTTRTPAQIVYPAWQNQKPLNNCEKLNRDDADLRERRDQLRTPGELATREEMLRKTEAELAHVQEMAQASNCKLAR